MHAVACQPVIQQQQTAAAAASEQFGLPLEYRFSYPLIDLKNLRSVVVAVQ
jgi:hypothetical protein